MIKGTPLRLTCDAIFRAALSSRLGYIVHTNNAFRCRKILYSYRDEIRDPSFAQIQIKISPDDTEYDLWLLNTGDQTAPAITSNGEAEIQL